MNFKDTVFFIVACFFILFLWESPVSHGAARRRLLVTEP